MRIETLEFLSVAPLKATAERVLPFSPEQVFDALADAESWPLWFAGLRKATWLTPPPHGVGAEREVVVGPLTVAERFVVWDRPTRIGFTFTGASGPGTRAGVELMELREVAGGTVLTYTFAVEPSMPRPVARVLGAALAPVVSKAMLGRGLAGLERYLAR